MSTPSPTPDPTSTPADGTGPPGGAGPPGDAGLPEGAGPPVAERRADARPAADARSAADARRLALAYLDAARAGQATTPLQSLDDDELDQPIGGPSSGPSGWDAAAGDPADAYADGRPPQIPGYRLDRLAGRGGQGAVYVGTQEATGLSVAVKVLVGGAFAPAADRRRHEREVEALAAVDHPNVVRVVDRGRTADGSFFLAMPFVDGVPLDAAAEALRRAPDHPLPVLRLLARVLAALRAVHAAGLVHRDLKPSNVLVDRWGEPRLLDFGLVRRSGPAVAGGLTVTAAHQILGSVAWASPEQALGRADRLDAASDVYAAGLLLYHALVGRPPYPTTGTLPEVLRTVVRARPDRPGRRLPAGSPVPRGYVDAVVLKALSKAPADRYPTAAELLADVERLVAGRRPTGRPRTPARTVLARCAVGLAVAAGGASWVASVRPWGSDPPPDTPVSVPARTNSVGMRLVRLPAGEFRRGSPPSEPGHTSFEPVAYVRVDHPLWVGATEVTRHQYFEVTGVAFGASADQDLPAVGVSWADATDFCRRLSLREGRRYRLPDEREWEYACRSGEVRPYAGTGRLADVGWHAGNSGGRPRPVGLLAPNHWGLFDMHGNVREWCGDPFHLAFARSADDPPDPGHAVRGGGYRSSADDCRSASRTRGPTDPADLVDVGFRVVADD